MQLGAEQGVLLRCEAAESGTTIVEWSKEESPEQAVGIVLGARSSLEAVLARPAEATS